MNNCGFEVEDKEKSVLTLKPMVIFLVWMWILFYVPYYCLLFEKEVCPVGKMLVYLCLYFA